MIEIEIQDNQSGRRLDRVLKQLLREAPDSFIYKMLRKKNITLNQKKAEGKEKTVTGDRIQFYLSESTFEKMKGEAPGVPENAPPAGFPEIPVLYEDADVLIFVKPSGVLSQKSVEESYSVNEWVLDYARRKGLMSGSDFELFRPSVVNRLDRNTGGIMAAGLSMKGLQVLSELFRVRSLSKEYYALVLGQVESPGELKSYLIKDTVRNEVRLYNEEVPGSKEIRTAYRPFKYDPAQDLTLLSVHLMTGRSHQIRAHMKMIGHPILGDMKYGDPAVNLRFRKSGQCLMACRIEFPECPLAGISGKTFEIPVPRDWPVSV